jgi:hypothetical protein
MTILGDLSIPGRVKFDRENHRGPFAEITTRDGDRVRLVPDTYSRCRPVLGEGWAIQPTRLIVSDELSRYYVVAVWLVPDRFAMPGLATESRRQKRHPKRERPQTGRFVEAGAREQWGTILASAGPAQRTHLSRDAMAPPPARGVAVAGKKKVKGKKT